MAQRNHVNMRELIISALLLCACSQAGATDQIISVQHDSTRGATCWIIPGTGISCLPDSQLRPQGITSKNQGKTRDLPAGDQFKEGPLPASAPATTTREAFRL
ncbi:hypothetical protein QL104_07470 [Pseudomonas piscis]|uniref:Lipoprotein n=1 Tax=Pseudomonas piscis TaxID=2614538 RepID=A0ABY9NL09_9PSED|nr:hypothetical protein [Pseudomonas piscis]WMN19238.1 hypothetical protein QL104_07470 [Pseudomonas piscis]